MKKDRDPAQVVDHALRCHAELSQAAHGAELEAVRLAILIEDVAGVVLADSQLDVAQLSDPSRVSALLTEQDDA